MNIFIAKDYNSLPLGIVLAKSRDVASAYFTGKYGAFDSIEEINPQTIEHELLGTPCFNIISTYKKEIYNGDRGTYRLINKR